eukprot:4030978-Alexandrium_andersonii.AAC.1
MPPPTGPPRWLWPGPLLAGARGPSSSSRRWTSLAGRAGGAPPSAVFQHTALRLPSASRRTAG